MWFAGTFLCAVQQRRGVVLGMHRQLEFEFERLQTSDALRRLLLRGCCFVRGEARFGLTAAVFTRAGIHARVCFGIEQRRCDGCCGRGKQCL
jgi:hypothetical protein